MWIDPQKLQKLCAKKKLSLNQLLRMAGVSKTAYYSLLRKRSVLPNSVHVIASALGTGAHHFLSWQPDSLAVYYERERQLRRIATRCPTVNPENAWHTLVLLELSPLERLEGALRRAG